MPKLRIPTQTKIIRGTFRKDRTAANEPRPERVVEVSRPPSYLSKYAKKLWKKLAGELVEKGILTVLDLPALEVCCEAYGQFREAQEIVFKVIVDPETRKRRRQTLTEYMKGRSSHSAPEYTAMNKLYQTFRLYLTEFGLTPAARSKLDLPATGSKAEDPMERLWNEP
jgi:P27 family predicted phage terminase small subunit